MNSKILIILFFSIFIFGEASNFEEEEIQKICSKCHSGFNDTYKDSNLLKNVSENDTINDYVKMIIEMLKTDFNSSELIDQYVTPRVINPNIIYIIFLVIVCLIWIALIVFICLNKKCLKYESKDETNHLKNHLLAYITMLIFAIIILFSSISLSFVHKSKVYFNSSICALLRIYIDVRDGDQAKTTQWKGIKKLQSDLVGDENTVNKLIEYINLQNDISNDLNNNKYKKKTFYDDEKNNDYYSDKQVASPSSKSSQVSPKYAKNRFEDINIIYFEYIAKLENGVNYNNQIQLLNRPIKDNPGLITNENLFINSQLNDILETVQFSAEEYLQYLIDIAKYVNKIAFPLLFSTFSLSLIFAVFGIIFIFLYIRDNKIGTKLKKIFSIILQILWNIILFLLLLTIVSQICFKIFEIFGEDGSGLLQYATSKDNFNNSNDSIIFRGAGNVFLETCFREDDDGDLLSKIIANMDHSSSIINNLTSIKNEHKEFQLLFKIMKKIQLNQTQNIINNLNEMYNDYSLIEYYNNLINLRKCQDDLDDLNEYTDYSNLLKTKQSSILGNKHSYDVWASKEENCKNYKKYEYIKSEKERKEGNNYCMVIEQFDKEIARNFYTGIKAIKSSILPSIITVDEAFEEYYDGFINFEEDNKKLLKENPNFIRMTEKYYNELIEIKEKILKGYEYFQKIIELVNKILGNSSGMTIGYDIFSVMNCAFLKRDLKVFYIEMAKLRANSGPFLVLSVFVAITLLSGAILVVFNIYKYKNEDLYNTENRSDTINSVLDKI